jgi:hypothetical protein
MNTLKFILFSLLLSGLTVTGECYGQESNMTEWLKKQELILKSNFDSLANAETNQQRIKFNDKISALFEKILKTEQSFEYPFDSIKNAGILTSSDQKLKIYNWNLPFDNGIHKYQCFIQYKPDGKKEEILTYQLEDNSDDIENPESAILHHPKWYGALYYRIIPIETRFNETYYTLLGYDMNDYLTNKKIVEILRFNSDRKPVFGASIFKNRKKISNRLIFEYSEFATMTLEYEEKKEMIVYDHLAPSSPKYEGQYEFYGPDFSYDGLKYEKGIWNTYYDLDLRLNKINIE